MGTAAMRAPRLFLPGLALAVGIAAWGGPTDEERPWSVQLHVHGSFSEGVGSIDSHSREASELGVDAIWWSDHDFRIATWRHASTFGFEDWSEPLDRGEPWNAWSEREERAVKELRLLGSRSVPGGSVQFVREKAVEGERCLQVRARSPGRDFADHLLNLRCDRALLHRPLAAEVTLRIAVHPLRLGPDARAAIEINLSEHDSGGELVVHRVVYLLTAERSEPWRDGATLFVPLAFEAREWNRYVLPLSRDVREGFPELPKDDNVLQELRLGVQTRRDAPAAVLFDELAIEQRTAGRATFARQREVMAEVARHYPDLRQIQGVEISAASHHLNEFSRDTEILDFAGAVRASGLLSGDPPRLDEDSYRLYLTRDAVQRVHGRGGLVSYNHMFGTDWEGSESKRTREEVLAHLLETRAAGADLLEVGYRDRGGHPLEDHLWIWDRLWLAGLPLTGLGVSDSHGGPKHRWRDGPNNLLSWIWAPSSKKEDLLEGLRAGRVFFGDIARFDGELDIVSARGFRMGQVVLTDRPDARATVRIEGLSEGDVVHVVESGERVARRTAAGAALGLEHVLELSQDPAFVRVEVYARDGTAVAFSNPLGFARALPAAGLSGSRAAVDVGGVRLSEVDSLAVLGATTTGRGASIEIAAAGGSATLTADGPDVDVTLEGLNGRAEREGSIWRLSELEGSGAIVVR